MMRKHWKLSEETKHKMSLARKGRNLGKTLVELYGVERATEINKKKSESLKRVNPSKSKIGKTYEEIFGVEKGQELREKRREAWTNNNPMKRPEVAAKTSKALKGRLVSEHQRELMRLDEWKRKMSARLMGNTFGFKKGQIGWNRGLSKEIDSRVKGWPEGKPFSEEHKKKLKVARARQVFPPKVMTLKVCPVCKVEFRVDLSSKKQVYCSRKCVHAARVGKSWPLRKISREEMCAKISKSKLGDLNPTKREDVKEKIRKARARQIVPRIDTKPEKLVQSILTKLGIQFKTHVPIGFHQVDILLLNSKDVLEIEGCFWHQCEICGFNDGFADRTAEEIREYDGLRKEKVEQKGFVVHRVWEHETRDLTVLEARIKAIVNVPLVVAR